MRVQSGFQDSDMADDGQAYRVDEDQGCLPMKRFYAFTLL